ncbi:MAG: DNA polymerase III subunit delta [Sciscionella sp.]
MPSPELTPTAVHLVLGDEELLVERAVAEVGSLARMVDPATETTRRRVSELTRTELAELLSPSLFASGLLIVLDGAEDAGTEMGEAIQSYARDPADGVLLVVLHSGGGRSKTAKVLPAALRKTGAQVIEAARITRAADREGFVRNEVRSAGGKIDAQAITALIEAVGSDLRELAAATSQLVADTGGAIDGAAVRRFHRGRAEVTGFVVAEKCVNGDGRGALEALRWALQLGVAHVLIADALADAVRTVARVSAGGGRDTGALASQLGMPPWKVRRAGTQARGWRTAGLATAMQVVAEVNAEVKGAAASPDYALERAVRRILIARGSDR